MAGLPSSLSPRRAPRGTSTAVLVVMTVAVLVLVGVGLVAWRVHSASERARAATAAAQALLRAFSAGDWHTLPVAGTTPAAVSAAYDAATKGLGAVHPQVTVGGRSITGHRMTAALQITWIFPGGQRWSYPSQAHFTLSDGRWLLDWSPAVIHPRLGPGAQLDLVREPATRAPIEGRGGSVLVTNRPVFDVGIHPAKATDLHQLCARLGALLGVDATRLEQRVKASPPDQFVPAITLRQADYAPVRTVLETLPGVIVHAGQLPLAPTRAFARSLLGTVGPVTKELLDASHARLAATDMTGLSGLSLQYDQRLSGTAGMRVDLVHNDTSGASTTSTLWSVAAVAGQPVRTTLDARVQAAADAALSGVSSPAALVAVDVATGDVRAVAVGPDPGGYDTALLGAYSPGSTFKIITTLALLRRGLSVTTPVSCPEFATVDGKTFHNYDHEVLGSVPFHVDFARSCNTAFIGASARLGRNDLTQAAAALGVGVPWALGTPAFAGKVPAASSRLLLAADSFGQGQVTMSPLAMAVAAASVAHGGTLTPRLVIDPPPTPVGPPPSPVPGIRPTEAATIAALMREVVTSGTGQVLNGTPGGPVSAKTGTAEYGTDNPPRTHAWMVGFQGQVAFAVFVHDGPTGAGAAGPIVQRFLRALAAG